MRMCVCVASSSPSAPIHTRTHARRAQLGVVVCSPFLCLYVPAPNTSTYTGKTIMERAHQRAKPAHRWHGGGKGWSPGGHQRRRPTKQVRFEEAGKGGKQKNQTRKTTTKKRQKTPVAACLAYAAAPFEVTRRALSQPSQHGSEAHVHILFSTF